jgi:tRNA-Thr(GGU) m(6)t(6)A37 methyltransferase TsaA
MEEQLQEIVVRPIGVVRSQRGTLEDDYWGGVIAEVKLDERQFSTDALAGLDTFSHIEVVFVMHQVTAEEIEMGARHPRGRKDWPRVGIFAQRAKMRPNRIGISCCRLLKVDGLSITVQGLDAINGTPVIDVKPYMVEFGPTGETFQPAWATELMKHYYDAR